MPDLPGMGGDRTGYHPFCHAQSLATSVLDMIRPALELLAASSTWRWDGRIFLAGYSAGGYGALAAVKELRPGAMVGQTHSMQEWESNAGGRPAMEYARRMGEDVFLEASREDDFIGVQTYSRTVLELPRIAAPLTRAALAWGPLERKLVSATIARQTENGPTVDPRDGIRRTQMGYEFRPQAVAATAGAQHPP